MQCPFKYKDISPECFECIYFLARLLNRFMLLKPVIVKIRVKARQVWVWLVKARQAVRLGLVSLGLVRLG